MQELFQNLLSLHIIAGFGAIFAFGYFWLQLKNPEYKQKALKILSAVGALSIFASWIIGGYYYLYWYGAKVKPAILVGDWPWAHKLIMESKEHIFLIIPLLSIVLLLNAILIPKEQIMSDLKLKTLISRLACVAVCLSIIMAVTGFIISSAH